MTDRRRKSIEIDQTIKQINDGNGEKCPRLRYYYDN
jgi:hypothetical protein